MGHHQSVIRVTGAGAIISPPKSFHLAFKVVAKGDSPTEIMNNAAARQRAVLESLRSVVSDDELVAHGASISENYRWGNEPDNEPRYQCEARITVQSEKLDDLSELVRLALEAGVDEVSEPDFFPEDADLDARDALALAAKAARERAELIAESLGVRLGGIVEVSDGSHGWGGGDIAPYAPAFRRRALSASTATITPEYVTAELSTSAQVQVTFALEE